MPTYLGIAGWLLAHVGGISYSTVFYSAQTRCFRLLSQLRLMLSMAMTSCLLSFPFYPML